MKKLSLLLFLIGTIVSCTNKPNEETEIPNINIADLWDSDDFVNLSEIAVSVEYIALEKTPDCILPEENKLRGEMTGNYLFITPRDHPVHVFSTKGKFLFKIGGIGKGPGEYLRAQVEYDTTDQIIWILDGKQNKILKYDHKGVYKTEFQVHSFLTKILTRNDGQLFGLKLHNRSQADSSEVQVWNNEGQILKRIPLYQNREPGSGSFNSISAYFGFQNDSVLHFNEAPFRKGYYLDENDSWQASWSLNQGDFAHPDADYYDGNYLSGRAPAILAVKETPNHFFMGGRKNGIHKIFIYIKNEQIVKPNHIMAETKNTMDMWGVFNDYDGGLPFWPRGNAGENQYLQVNDALRYIDLAEGYLTYYGTDKITPISAELKHFCEDLETEDNPVVMVVTLK